MQNEIILETADIELAKSLFTDKIKDVKVATYNTRAFPTEPVIKAIVEFGSDVAVGVFSSWLYDKIKDKSSKKTTINKSEVPHDIHQIIVLIQQNFEPQQAHYDTDKND